MKGWKSISIVILVGGLAACDGKRDSSSTTSTNLVVQKGSGEECPNLRGRYRCTAKVDDEILHKTISFRTRKSESQTFKIDDGSFSESYQADGQIHDGEDHQYSVDCTQTSLGLHVVSTSGEWSRIILNVQQDRSLSVYYSGVAEGKSSSSAYVCK